MSDTLSRLHKTILVCVVLAVSGGLLIALDKNVEFTGTWEWLALVPWSEFGAILFGAGILGIGLDAYLARETGAIAEQQLDQIFERHATTLVDAVLRAFAAGHKDLARVATPDMLDQMITNSLSPDFHMFFGSGSVCAGQGVAVGGFGALGGRVIS